MCWNHGNMCLCVLQCVTHEHSYSKYLKKILLKNCQYRFVLEEQTPHARCYTAIKKQINLDFIFQLFIFTLSSLYAIAGFAFRILEHTQRSISPAITLLKKSYCYFLSASSSKVLRRTFSSLSFCNAHGKTNLTEIDVLTVVE